MTEKTIGEPSIMLCLSPEDKKLGSDFALSPDDLGSYACITLVMDREMARRILRESPTYREVWVAAGNEVEAVRLAAEIKAEASWRMVYLVQREPTVSARGRAHEIGLDGVLSLSELVWRCETFNASDAYLVEPMRPPAVRPEAVPACPAQSQPMPPSAPELLPVPEQCAPYPIPAPLPMPASAPVAPPVPGAAVTPLAAPVPSSAPVPPSAAEPASLPALAPAPSAPLPEIAASLQPVSQGALLPCAPQPPGIPYPQERSLDCAGSLVSVVSGSGGSGKSTVAALLARQAHRRGLRSALVDGDLQFGDLATLASPTVFVPLDEVAEKGFPAAGFPPGELVLFAAPSRLEASELVVPQFESILQQLLARFDVVVVNTGGNWGELHALLLEKSTVTLMLIDQRSSSVRACRHALDLCLRCGIATNAFTLVLNRCCKQARFSGVDVSEVLHGARVAELFDGGSEVEEMMGSSLVETLIQRGNPMAASIDRLLSEVLPGLTAAPQVMAAPLAPASCGPVAQGAREIRHGSAKGAPPKKRGRLRRRSAAPC